MHYYNDFDSGAADWLENLIAAGLIPDGVVDRRSIKDVDPRDLEGFVQCHFFAGIGGWPAAARLAGWRPDRHLWSASCPCQPYSVAGQGLGADDPRNLWPDFYRLVRAGRPAVIVGEQVSGALGYGWVDGVRSDLGAADYAFRVVDVTAAAVDSPQIRQRLYWGAIRRDLLADADDGGRAAQARGAGEREHRVAVPERGDDALALADAADQGPDGLRQGLDGDGARRGGSGDDHARDLADAGRRGVQSGRTGRGEARRADAADGGQGLQRQRGGTDLGAGDDGRGGGRPLADGAGEQRGEQLEVRGPEGRTPAAGDAAGERCGGLVDSEGLGRGEGLADAELRGRGTAPAVADLRECDPDLADSGYGPVGDADLDWERQPGGPVGEERRWVAHPDARVRPGHGGSRCVVDSEGGEGGPGLRQDGALGHGAEPADADGGGRVDELVDAAVQGPQGLEDAERLEGGAAGRPDAERATGGDRRPNGSFWSGSGRLVCHDGKVRRIPQPAIPMLVNGLRGRVAVVRPGSEETREIARVAAWKGFGNAIVLQLAAEWVAALQDVAPDLAPALLDD